MTTDRHSHAEQKNLIEDPDEIARQEAQNGIRQFELLIVNAKEFLANTGGATFKLRPSTILGLQEAALHGINNLAGTYRNTPIIITGSKHAPPDFLYVADEINELCNYVNGNFEHKTAIHLAAYVLWKLNWIHPFSDGNGRTARAISYLVLLVKLGVILPGTPTIPEQIAADKGPYYDALEAADAAQDDAVVDVTALETMIERMLINQLTARPLLPQKAQSKVRNTFVYRIEKASDNLRRKCYGSEKVAHQLWSVGDHIILQVASPEAIKQSDDRSLALETPFPRLLAIGSAPASEIIDVKQKGAIIIGKQFNADCGYALKMSPDVYVTLEGGRIEDRSGHKWSILGTLYVARMGTEIKEENLATVFDFLISKHLSVSST